MNKTAIRARVQRLETAVATMKTAEPLRVPSRFLDGVFTGVIQDGDGLAVNIARPLTFTRDADGSWLVYSGDHDASVSVLDPLACDALDAVFELAANPNSVGNVFIREPND